MVFWEKQLFHTEGEMIFALDLGAGGEKKEVKRKRRKNKRRHINGDHSKIIMLAVLRTTKPLRKLAGDHEADGTSSRFFFLHLFGFQFLFPPPFLSTYPLIFSPLSSIFFSLTPAGLPLLVHGELGVWACVT